MSMFTWLVFALAGATLLARLAVLPLLQLGESIAVIVR